MYLEGLSTGLLAGSSAVSWCSGEPAFSMIWIPALAEYLELEFAGLLAEPSCSAARSLPLFLMRMTAVGKLRFSGRLAATCNPCTDTLAECSLCVCSSEEAWDFLLPFLAGTNMRAVYRVDSLWPVKFS